MHINRFFALIASIFFTLSLYAWSEEQFYIYFKPGSAVYDPSLSDNAATVAEIQSLLLQAAETDTLKISAVAVYGLASPEGNAELNEELSRKRRQTLENIIRNSPGGAPVMITSPDTPEFSTGIAWTQLRQWVEGSSLPYRNAVIAIIDSNPELVPYGNGKEIDSRVVRLQELDGGAVWQQINEDYFSRMRAAVAVVSLHTIYPKVREPERPVVAPKPLQSQLQEPDLPEEVIVEEEVFEVLEPVYSEFPLADEPEWNRKIYIKTNAVGWAMANANLAGEIDICRHLSFNLPVYYSAMNYFTYKVKFRTFSVQPEFRFWISPENDRFFIGAHFGMSYFNFGFNGDYRYQDHDGKSPALGGGISLGYRWPISRNKRWKMEVSVGGGIYKVHYDKFINAPNGPLVGSFKKTYYGLDQVAVAFSYTFNLK